MQFYEFASKRIDNVWNKNTLIKMGIIHYGKILFSDKLCDIVVMEVKGYNNPLTKAEGVRSIKVLINIQRLP